MRIKLLFFILTILFSFPFTVFSQQEMVRMVYFYGKDRIIAQNDVKTKMTTLANSLLYIYDGLIFEKENDALVVHIVKGSRNAADYTAGQGIFNFVPAEPDKQILDEIREAKNFDMSKNLYLVVANVDNPSDICGSGGTVIYPDFGDRFWGDKQPFEGAWGLIYETTECVQELSIFHAAHELGHAFGLLHDFRDPSHIMSYGASGVEDSNGNIQWTIPDKLSTCATEWLKASRFFNANFSTAQQGTLSISSKIYYQNTKELHLQLIGTGVDALHQIQLHAIPSTIPKGFSPNDSNRDSDWLKLENKYSLNSCHTFEQTQTNKNQVVLRNVSLSKDSGNNLIKLRVIDINGNIAFGDISADTIEFKDAPMAVGTTAEQQVVTDQPNATDVSQESRLRATLKGHTDFVSSLAFSPNGSKLVSGSWDNSIKLWDPQTTENIATDWHAHDVTSVTYSPDGLRIASSGVDEVIRLWNSTLKSVAKSRTYSSIGAFTSVVFLKSSDNRYYRVAASDDLSEYIWSFYHYFSNSLFNSPNSLGGRHATSSLAVSPDQSLLASGGSKWDANVILRNPDSGKVLRTLKGHTDFITSVAFSPDRRTLASSSWDNTVRLWNIADGKPIAVLRGHTDRVLSVAFSPDGRTLASGSDDQTIRLWDVATHRQKDTLLGHTSGVTSLAFNPNRITYMLASAGGWDNTVRLWDLSPAPTPAPTVSIAPSPIVSPTVGKELVIKVDIAGVQDVAGYQATVHFDPTALRYVESANGTYLPTGSLFVPPVVSANQVILAATSLSEDSDGAGTLATLTFEVVAVKPSQITLSDVMIMKQDLTSIPIIVKNGDVVVSSEEALDVNGDGIVNIQDLTIVATHFGKVGDSQADVNGDSVVDIRDLLLVAGAINADAAAPSTYSIAISTLTVEEIQMWLSQAQQVDLSDATYQRGFAVLQQLLIAATPKETALLPNYPNPFNPETWIPYQLATPADVTVTIYAVNGAVVRTLKLGHQPVGIYESRSRAAYWDGRNALGESVASAVYFYTLTAGDFSATRKMLIRK